MFHLERLSIDLSNRCSKQCEFCYNHSSVSGSTLWLPSEVIDLVKDCAANGLQALSLGGGEPFEYEGIFEIISALTPIVFVSVTTNGFPLRNKKILKKLLQNKPDKIHFSIHNPENSDEVDNALYFIELLRRENIRAGVNMLVSADKIQAATQLFQRLENSGIQRNEIILLPRKFNFQPTPQQVSQVADGKPFQSPSCLTQCQPSKRFCSLSWDKQVNFCSYSPSKALLQGFTYQGIINALNTITFKTCQI
ncbi:MAG: radical SAM protein [Candidatus Symbiothrix sp.]|jgi:organic radical activating enzyme|nr:radical SAM protein [Candidatus Symbiothrix sp.]